MSQARLSRADVWLFGPNQVVAHAGEGFDAYAAPVVSIPIPASRARTIASAREVAPIFQKMFVT